MKIPATDTNFDQRASPVWSYVWKVANKRSKSECDGFWSWYWGLDTGKQRDRAAGEMMLLAGQMLEEDAL